MIKQLNKWIHHIELSNRRLQKKDTEIVSEVDLSKFISGNNVEDMERVDCLGAILTITPINGHLTGFVFYEFNALLNGHFQQNCSIPHLQKAKDQRKVEQMYLVFVKDDFNTSKATWDATTFEPYATIFNQVLLFDYHQAILEKIA